MNIYRQGDVLIIEIDTQETARLLATAKPVKREAGRIVLAYGEVTGHAHAIANHAVKMFEVSAQPQRILTSEVDFAILHEEHIAVKVPAGTYRVIRQREWTDDDEVRYVAD